jgi:hypothetical protein
MKETGLRGEQHETVKRHPAKATSDFEPTPNGAYVKSRSALPLGWLLGLILLLVLAVACALSLRLLLDRWKDAKAVPAITVHSNPI